MIRPPGAPRGGAGRLRKLGPEVRPLLPLLYRRRGGLRLAERARHGAGRRGGLLLVGLGLLGLAAGPLLALRHHRSPVGGCREPPTVNPPWAGRQGDRSATGSLSRFFLLRERAG